MDDIEDIEDGLGVAPQKKLRQQQQSHKKASFSSVSKERYAVQNSNNHGNEGTQSFVQEEGVNNDTELPHNGDKDSSPREMSAPTNPSSRTSDDSNTDSDQEGKSGIKNPKSSPEDEASSDDMFASLGAKKQQAFTGEVKIQPRPSHQKKKVKQAISSAEDASTTEQSGKSTDQIVEETMDEARQEQVPGVGRIWVKTFGCAHNMSDSEYMAGQLEWYGFNVLVDESLKVPENIDCAVINSCTVKGPSESRFLLVVKRLKEKSIPVVVTGCVPQGDRSIKELESCSVVGVQQIDRIVEAVEQTIAGNTVKLLAKNSLPRLDLPKVRRNPLVEIIPLSTGCLGQCTYCKTKHARGKLGSYEPQAIVSRVQQVMKEGVKEIWLSSEDVGAYGRDLGIKMPDLLRQIVDVLPSDPSVMLRVGMSNPPYMLDSLEELAAVLRHPNVYSFLHIPVQAGSNAVLEGMKREYTVEEFQTCADYLLENVPGMTIATDIICGFPGETAEDWEQTMQLCRKYKFPVLNISQFYPRPGTPAASMKQLSGQVKKERSRELTTEMQKWHPYDHFVGTVQRVWIGHELANNGDMSVGHTKSYAKVLLPRDDALKGSYTYAKIVEAQRWHVVGEYTTLRPEDDVLSSGRIIPYSRTKEEKVAEKNYEWRYQVWMACFMVLVACLIACLSKLLTVG